MNELHFATLTLQQIDRICCDHFQKKIDGEQAMERISDVIGKWTDPVSIPVVEQAPPTDDAYWQSVAEINGYDPRADNVGYSKVTDNVGDPINEDVD